MSPATNVIASAVLVFAEVLSSDRNCASAGSTTAFANAFPSVTWSPHKVVRAGGCLGSLTMTM